MTLGERVARRILAGKYDQKEKKQNRVDRVMRLVRDQTGLSRGISEDIVDALVRGRDVEGLALQKGWPIEEGKIVGPSGEMSLKEVRDL